MAETRIRDKRGKISSEQRGNNIKLSRNHQRCFGRSSRTVKTLIREVETFLVTTNFDRVYVPNTRL